MNLREFRKAYKGILSAGWKIELSSNTRIQTVRLVHPELYPGRYFDPITVTASVVTGGSLGESSRRTRRQAAKLLELSDVEIKILLACLDMSPHKLREEHGCYATKLRRLLFSGYFT